MKFIRWFLGKIILTLNSVFSPKGIVRTAEEQQEVDNKASSMALYQFEAVPILCQSSTCDEAPVD